MAKSAQTQSPNTGPGGQSRISVAAHEEGFRGGSECIRGRNKKRFIERGELFRLGFGDGCSRKTRGGASEST